MMPDLSEWSRCVSMHWSLPAQCDLPCTHRENWHETWRPDTDNRLRYRRAFGTFRTEELIDGEWTLLDIPPPVNERDELLAKLTEAEADRDRARDAAVALEQQLAEIKKLAYMGGQNGEVIRAAILGVFEGDLHEEAL